MPKLEWTEAIALKNGAHTTKKRHDWVFTMHSCRDALEITAVDDWKLSVSPLCSGWVGE